MQVGLRMSEFLGHGSGSTAPHWISWSALWRGGLLALLIIFVLSTQLLFQFDLYESWALPDVLLGWLDHFVDQLIVGGCIFAGVAVAVLIPASSTIGKHLLVLASITLGALAGEGLLMLRLPLPPGISVAGVLFNGRPGMGICGEGMHSHPAHLTVVLADWKGRATIPDGTARDRERKLGDVFWSEAETHKVENTGKSSSRVLIIELKTPAKA